MNRIEFISGLINNPKLTVTQRERVFHLVSKELESIDSRETLMIEEINGIKEKIGSLLSSDQMINTVPSAQNTKALPKDDLVKEYLDPLFLFEFLNTYNQNPILKYTCHKFDDPESLEDILSLTGDEQYCFTNHLKLIKQEYKSLVKAYDGKITKNIISLINNYLNGPSLKDVNNKDNGWSYDNIKINWSSPQLAIWCGENLNCVPNPGENFNYFPFTFPNIELASNGETLNNFSDLVIHFKHLFHIRFDNSLRQMLERSNGQFFTGKAIINFSEEFPENIEFFTSVDKVKQAYKKIIEMCIRYASDRKLPMPIINLSLKENPTEGNICLNIHHLNSTFGRTAEQATRRGEKLTGLILKQLNGVCDLYLKADFGSKDYANVNLWSSQEINATRIEAFEGVEFTLKFRTK